jgi:hypothetical protein
MKTVAKRRPYYLLVLPTLPLCLCFLIQFGHAEGSWGWFIAFVVDIPVSGLIVATTHPLRDFGTLGTLWWFFLSWCLMRSMQWFSGESQLKSKWLDDKE